MKKQGWVGLAVAVLVLSAAGFWGYQKWRGPLRASRSDLLAIMPAEASAVLFADLEELRHAPFVAVLYRWTPQPQADPDYAQFVKDTGFDYERDLDRLAVAFVRHGQDSNWFAIANGRFDRQKISAYGARSGTVAKTGGPEIFIVPVTGSAKRISFAFLRNDQIALTDADLGGFLSAGKEGEDKRAWSSRFERLAGSPVFAVIRQDAALGSTLTTQAPGGLRSPQLSALLDQLQWITVAGKPENDRLRVVADGECTAESTARQLADMLNGVVILAQAGLNDAKIRQQLDPAARQAYLELLKNTEVSRMDRGETKSVRVVFEITPEFLEAASHASPAAPDSVPGKTPPRKAPASKKGQI